MNMKHFIRTAFWIVTLSVCLPAKSFPIMDINDSNIKLMRTEVKCLLNSALYTPSNVKDHCMNAALECFKVELNGTVKAECEDPKKVIEPALEFLELVTKKRSANVNSNALEESSKCHCETWPQTPFNKFLNSMESFLQQINTAALT